MPKLSPVYREIKRLRSTGDCATAISMLRTRPALSDEDAFEAVVCLFVCGDLDSALHVCRTYSWKQDWARNITGALSERLLGGSASRALSLARKAVSYPAAPHDASAIYLLLLQDNRLLEEADACIKSRLQNAPASETFLLTIVAEVAVSTQNWRAAYRAASAVLYADPDDYRALVALSIANFEIGSIHESLGNAKRASFLCKGSPPAILQIMRCQNALGDYYAALAAFEKLGDPGAIAPEIHAQLGTAYAGLEDPAQAILEYREALATDARPTAAIRGLTTIYAARDDRTALDAFIETYSAEIDGDIECVNSLGLAALNRGDMDRALSLFRKTRALAVDDAAALYDLPWPVSESRIRHDYEQLDLLDRRGRLDHAGRDALKVLTHYYDQAGDLETTFAPTGAEAQALKNALCTAYYVPDLPFAGPALGENDYAAIEAKYLSDRIVVIDNFLSSGALGVLRGFCEEATVWKINNQRGYVGAVLAQGFSPKVLLAIADHLKKAMPQVLGPHPLLQAWAFKYDQRMQGINLHADFAQVNVNFWITPDEACEDSTNGGMVVYDVPVPKSWTFAEYNSDSEKLAVYLKAQNARPHRVPYRANRCVLFDSSLIHSTDEMHFRAGYENRRVNVTLLYGRARSLE